MPPRYAILFLAGIAAINAVAALFLKRDFRAEASLAFLLILIAVAIVALAYIPDGVAPTEALG